MNEGMNYGVSIVTTSHDGATYNNKSAFSNIFVVR